MEENQYHEDLKSWKTWSDLRPYIRLVFVGALESKSF